jgi:hypothetical protein
MLECGTTAAAAAAAAAAEQGVTAESRQALLVWKYAGMQYNCSSSSKGGRSSM